MLNKRNIILIIVIVAVLILTIAIVAITLSSNKEIPKSVNITNEDATENIENVVINEVEEEVVKEQLIAIKEKGKIAEVRSEYTDENSQKAVIPAGYAVVKDSETISSGLVISDIADDDLKNSKGGNQFVWVPVGTPFLDVSKYTTELDINEAIQNSVDNGKYPMSIKISNTEYAGVFYKFEAIRENTVIKVIPLTYGKNATEREPSNLNETIDNSSNIKGWTTETYQTEYNEMVKKVINDNGFWIARFETSVDSNGIAQSKIDNKVLTNTTWYNLYETQKSLKTYTTISHMVWGSQWDQIMIWIKNTKNANYKNNPYFILDSTGMGNYLDTEIKESDVMIKRAGESIRFKTGETQCAQIRNIYDLAGNAFEWTMESYYTSLRTVRGGYCAFEATMYPVSARFSFTTDYTGEQSENIGSRMTIY